MNPSREELLFQLASMKPAGERASFLDRECAHDPALRARLEALLASHDQSQGLKPLSPDLDGPTVEITDNELHDETIGSTIGRYKVLQSIGEGGCGAVYMAEQTEPVRRRVALKVIKLGMDTKAVIARFEAERQALALMDHPNIAKVLDAGSTDSGRPYFVMELVRGIRITDYCDQNKLDTQQRLELFIQICQAIQHAHQKGIIHRDIKPSNILVTLHDGIPVPKVIDFGIAKATTDQRLTDKTLFTAYEQFIGTPAYMSPEQAEMSGLDIDTRSDIYSLGVLLYELLTGRTPFDGRELMSLGIDAMRKTIREQEPPRPSMKLHTLQGAESTTTAQSHGAEMPRLIHSLRGDLDWIVMKCLEKDRVRRYDTANGLAMDIQRHLKNEPVVARPPSKLYELQKTVRRHKVGFAATTAIMAVLAVGVTLTTWQAVRATNAKQEALKAQASEIIQRQKAEANEQNALAAQANELRLRKEAEEAELKARQRAYASDMNVAKLAVDGDNLGRALSLLDRQRPGPGQKDLRGWEWRYLWEQTRSDALFTLCQVSNEINSLAVSADGNWLAVGEYHAGGVSVWDLRSRIIVSHLVESEGHVRTAFSPTKPVLAFTSVNNPTTRRRQATLHLWDGATQRMLLEKPLDSECAGLAFSSDGDKLVASTVGGHITVWQVPEGTNLVTLARYPAQQIVQGPALTPFAATRDLRLAAYSLPREQFRIIDLRDGTKFPPVTAAKDYVTALAFSPDGRTLASAAGFGENDIRLWDVETGRELTPPLEGHTAFVSSMVFLPDGKLASSSGDQTIRIWDVANRKCLQTLKGHTLEAYRVILAPDGKTLVSGSKNGEVCLWNPTDTPTRQPRITLEGTIDWSFAADSESVLTLDQHGNVSKWTGRHFPRDCSRWRRTGRPPGSRRAERFWP